MHAPGPLHRAAHESWSQFTWRAAHLAHSAKLVYDPTAARAHGLHMAALQRTKALVHATPYLRDLFPGDSDSEVLLVYAYLLLGAAALKIAMLFVRDVLYA